MSQKKVDQYKESKRNRKKEMEKAKKKAQQIKIGVIAVCVAIVLFIGASVVKDYVIPAFSGNSSTSVTNNELDEKYADLDAALLSSPTDAK